MKQKCSAWMRTRAKQKHVASDGARRPDVPRHILFITLPVVFAPIIFAENMVRCTEIMTGEDLGVTGFCFWKTSERMQKRKPANCQNPA